MAMSVVFLWKPFRTDWFKAECADVEFVQDNHSKSKQGILRGLHYQLGANPGQTGARSVSGEVFDVAVDMRKDSETFGHWVGVYLSAENKRQLWVPAGFAHGFYVTSLNRLSLCTNARIITTLNQRCR